MYNFKESVVRTAAKIRPYVRETPFDYSISLSKDTGANVFLKCENLQYTGSFKVRGAINKLLRLSEEEKN